MNSHSDDSPRRAFIGVHVDSASPLNTNLRSLQHFWMKNNVPFLPSDSSPPKAGSGGVGSMYLRATGVNVHLGVIQCMYKKAQGWYLSALKYLMKSHEEEIGNFA